MKYSLNDIFVVPAPVSTIESRAECSPYYSNGMLPLFTAPMSSVVGLENYKIFERNKINPIIPRTIELKNRKELCLKTWCAFSLDEFIDMTHSDEFINCEKTFMLIDIANGHMLKLHEAIKFAKNKFGNKIVIMAGNIASPETYRLLSDAGADFIRLGIGSGCFTGNMKVKTDNGLINIKDIKIGDNVLTHTGEYSTVDNIMSYSKDEEILEINGIECTKNHEFYVVENKYKNLINDNNYKEYAKWISAEELNKNIHLLIEL